MRHNQYKELLPLLVYDELTADEHDLLDKHLHDCDECQMELEALKGLHATLAQAGPVRVEDDLLRDARTALRSALHKERSRTSLWNRVTVVVSDPFGPNLRLALGGVALVVIGVLAGRMTFSSRIGTMEGDQRSVERPSAFLDGAMRVSNVHFVKSDERTGQVEFTFDAVSPVHMNGNINDERIQKVLAHALVNDENPGVRLRSVSAFSAQIERLKLPDKEVKAALILALKTDNNPGVRQEALKTLQGFPFDEEIKQAFLHVLMRDTNPALRIAAINSLDTARAQGSDKELLEVLKQRMQSDDNNYIRIRAREVLEEIKQQ